MSNAHQEHTLTVKADLEWHRQLKARCALLGLTIAECVRDGAELYLARKEDERSDRLTGARRP